MENDHTDEAWLREQYRELNRSTEDMAEECDVSRGAVEHQIRKYGIKRKYRDGEWLEERVEEGRSMKEIADIVDVTPQTIRRQMDEAGVTPLHERSDERELRFKKLVDERESCTLWMGCGRFEFNGKGRKPKHIAWFLQNGEWPSVYLRRTCDTENCIAPDHQTETAWNKEGCCIDAIRSLDETELAYLAGLIDADGSISISNTDGYYAVNLLLTNTSSEMLRWVEENVGSGVASLDGRGENWDDVTNLEWKRGEDKMALLEALKPYLVAKNEQAENALRMLELKAGRRQRAYGEETLEKFQRLYEQQQQLNGSHGK